MATTSFNSASAVTVTLTNSNLTATSTGTSASVQSIDFFPSGSANKFYFEYTLQSAVAANDFYGVAGPGYVYALTNYAGCLVTSGTIYTNGGSSGIALGAFVNGDVLCCAVDLARNQIWFRKNAGNWNNSATANPAISAGSISIGGFSAFFAPSCRFSASGSAITANFGASTFAQAAPSGFTAGWSTGAGTYAELTQAGLEVFAVGQTPAVNLTQAGLEIFAVGQTPAVNLTQVGLEIFASTQTGVTAALAATEQRDIASFNLSGTNIAQLAATERRDVASFSTFIGIRAVLAATEQRDVAAFSMLPPIHLAFALNDAIDTANFQLSTAWSGETTIFPVFPGLGFPVQRKPNWRTVIASHPSGGETRTALWPYPLWEFELTLEGLSGAKNAFGNLIGNSYQELLGFYLAHGGQLTAFLFRDPIFNQQTGGFCGAGDGTTTAFLFMRTIGGAAEPASWVVPTPTVYLNGLAQPLSTWQLVPPNNLVFLSPPGAGATITADFNYMFTCRFAEDSGDYEQQMINLFDMKSLKLRQVRTT